jgi:hypothetical protein
MGWPAVASFPGSIAPWAGIVRAAGPLLCRWLQRGLLPPPLWDWRVLRHEPEQARQRALRCCGGGSSPSACNHRLGSAASDVCSHRLRLPDLIA